MIDSKELFARAGFSMEEKGEAEPEPESPPAAIPPPAKSEGKITLPPPVPVNEYVAQMMVRRPHSSSEITAVQRMRPDVHADDVTQAPSRKTIPWDPPKLGRDREPPGARAPLSKEVPRLGFECDEPGVASRPAHQLELDPLLDGSGPTSRRAADRGPRETSPSPWGVGGDDFDAIDSPQVTSGRWTVPRPAQPPSRPEARGGGASDIDFRLDLGLGFDDPNGPIEEPVPMTPPPGTLRYGLLPDDEDDLGLRASSIPPGASRAYQAVGARGGLRIRDELDPGLDDDTFPGHELADDPRATIPDMGPDPREQMKHRFEAGDFGGALVLAEGLIEENPNDREARRYVDSCTEMLRQMYQSRLGDGSRVLRIVVSPDELKSLNLDHRAGFLLSCIDGFSSIDEILDVSGMQTLEALRILYELVQEGVVGGNG